MNLTALAIKNRTTTYFVTALLFVAGIAAFYSLGQLEDPEFSVKTAYVITPYPGASPSEVELEVTDSIEKAVQEMSQIDYIESDSRAGVSIIKIDMKAKYWGDELDQIWDELRRKVSTVQTSLPPGSGPPTVNDSFGDVFGHLLAITGDGFSYAELEDYADEVLKKELNVVEGVSRVDLWGVQQKIIYIDVSETQLSQFGATAADVITTLNQQGVVVDAGNVDTKYKRLRISPSGEFQTPEDIADLAIRPSSANVRNLLGDSSIDSSEITRIRDIGKVRRGYLEPSLTNMRFNGTPSLAIAISNLSGVNIVTMGKALDEKIEELETLLPVGVELHKIHWQSKIVNESVNGFLISLAEAVAIVLVVLAIFMGWRMGIIIGTALIMTIVITFIIMAIFGIDLQRMSLGALVIALGMMVDNSIVVADGVMVRLQQGKERTKAAIEAATLPSIPLLGATIIAVMAFYPIFASTENAGEYCRTLFTVVAISLLTSWVISLTITPIQCIDMLPVSEASSDGESDPYGGKFYALFRNLLHLAIKLRWLTIGTMIGLLVISIYGFSFVSQLFFPESAMKKFMIDFWSPQGTRIELVSDNLKTLEQKLLDDDRIEGVSTFIGAGPPRFYLPVDPERNNAAYGQIIVNVKDHHEIDGLIEELTPWVSNQYPNALVPLRKYGLGPSNTWKFEFRISGPARVDSGKLRSIAEQGLDILANEPLAGLYQTDWRQKTLYIEPIYNQERARWSAITRSDIGNTTKRAYDGRMIGLYRERDDQIPILMRNVEEERKNIAALDVLQVSNAFSTDSLPISQVIDGTASKWEDPIRFRRDRRPTLTIQANPAQGVTLPSLMQNIESKFDNIEVPPGFTFEYGGEKEDSAKAQNSLIPGVIPAVALMAIIIVGLFNAFKPPLVILFTIPFALIGITAGLLISGAPFGFVALLAAMSLAGMMIKNAIVLLDQANIFIAAGKEQYDAIIEAAVSRLRPVMLAAGTTVLGVIPLLQDVFWVGMAVVIMAGLTFGTVLTMVIGPVLYSTLFKLSAQK